MSSIESSPPFVGEELKNAGTRTCAVLGGRGFLGRSLVSRLLQLGDWIVRIADSDPSLQPDPNDSAILHAISSGRASYHRLDLLDTSLISKAIEGSSVVFYMESTNVDKSDFYQCYMIMVQGAKNVISACRQCKVRQLIYNSSADVVFDGSHDICNGDESLPWQWRHDDMLTDLKGQAESLILSANNIDGLLTCALRPSNVFGPGDTQLLPLFVNLAKSGLAKLIVGHGENMSDFTYCENVVHAHLCAAKALDSRMVFVAGKTFFITNLQPINFWDFVSLVLEGLGYQRQYQGGNLDSRKLLDAKFSSPSSFVSLISAKKHIGYSPLVSMEDGISLTIKSFSHLTKDASVVRDADFEEQSKAEKFLGGGKVADILLWRDEKTTFTYFLALVALFYWFLLSGRSFTTSAANLLILVTTFLYGYGMLPPEIWNVTVPEMSSSCFEIQGTLVKESMTSIACLWNRGVHHLRLLARGQDWKKFFKVAFPLYLLKLILLQSLTMVMGKALIFAFTAFFVYEQYEYELDGFVMFLFNAIKLSYELLMRNLPVSMAPSLRNRGMLHENNGPDLVHSKKIS